MKSEYVKDRICEIFKVSSVILCLVGFALTSSMVFYNFINCTTVISTTVVPSPSGSLEMPILLICNSSAYKEQILDTKLDAFKKNTMSLEDALIDASLVIQNPGASILENRIVSVTKDAKEISTLTHGRCMIFDLKRKFRQTDFIWLELNSEFDLNLYVINPGDDIFVPFFQFPTPPAKKHLPQNLAWSQITLTKETKETKRNKNQRCKDNDGYVYGECIRKHIREYYAGKRKEKLRNCTVPWTIDISGVIKNIESNIPCSTDNSAFQSIEVSDYFVRASTYKFPQCKVPCEESSYKIEETAYDSDSMITTHMHRHYKAAYNFTTPENKTTYTVYVSFKTTDVNFSEEVKMSNVSDFVSSIGGNLGLFLGFSVLNLLKDVAEWANKIAFKKVTK